MTGGELVAARGVGRAYGPVRAVSDVTLGVRPGEVLALVGHNGAGKSTLTRILSGAERPDTGHVEVDGSPVVLRSPDDAISRRILLVPQHLSLAPNLTVRENLLLGPWPGGGRAERERRLAATAAEFGLGPLLGRPAGSLRPAASRHVMIARALLRRPRVLVLDEPTAMLAGPDTDHLFRVVRELTAGGAGVLYITHRLPEVLRIADRIAVMRNGALTTLAPAAGVDRERLTEWIVGSAELAPEPAAAGRPAGGGGDGTRPVRLSLRGLRRGRVGPVDLDVRAGEIVGLTGLVGSGRTSLLRLVCGIDAPTGGTVRLDGRAVRWRSPRDAIRAGLAFQPEDRARNAVVPGMSVAATMLLPHRSARRPLVTARRDAATAGPALARLRVLPQDAARLPVGALSGGNQQKALIGRWLLGDPAVVVLDEPTEGIDVGSKQEIYRLVEELAGEGRAVLFASSDLEEVAALAHRVLVLAHGRPAAELRPPDLDVETIARACLLDVPALSTPSPAGAAE